MLKHAQLYPRGGKLLNVIKGATPETVNAESAQCGVFVI